MVEPRQPINGVTSDPESYLAMTRRIEGWCGRPVIWHQEIDSTNAELKRLPVNEFTHGILCVAEHQTAGRGQRERSWQSPAGLNLLFSVGFRPSVSQALPLLTLAIANELSVVLEELLSTPVRLKWPNDLYVSGRKISGILTETVFSGSALERVIVGVGVNVNQTKFPDNISEAATSMAQISGVEWNRVSVLTHLISGIGRAFDRWSCPDERSSLVTSVHRRLLGYGEWVSVQLDGVSVGKFKCLGVDLEGRLMLLDPEMNVRSFTHQQIRLLLGDTLESTAEKLGTPHTQIAVAPSEFDAEPTQGNAAPSGFDAATDSDGVSIPAQITSSLEGGQ